MDTTEVINVSARDERMPIAVMTLSRWPLGVYGGGVQGPGGRARGCVRCCSSYTGAAAAVCGITRTDWVEEKGKGPADNDTITNWNPNWSEHETCCQLRSRGCDSSLGGDLGHETGLLGMDKLDTPFTGVAIVVCGQWRWHSRPIALYH